MEKITYKNLDQSPVFKQLVAEKHPVDLRTALAEERIAAFSAEGGAGLVYNYAAKAIDEKLRTLLCDLAVNQQVLTKFGLLVSGEIMNTGEQRKVLHHLTRGRLGPSVMDGKQNLGDFYDEQRKRVFDFSDAVRAGDVRGSTGKPFDTVVQIGIGGSDLGPRALYLALRHYRPAGGDFKRIDARFISNVDPDDPNAVLEDIDFERTLFILVTKSGTTQETLTNQEFVIRKMESAGIPGIDPSKHMVVVTSMESPLAKSQDFLEAFYINDYIGGRYSSTSAVGGAVLSLAFGKDCFAELLEGAHEADERSLGSDIPKNAALMDALIGVYERNVMGLPHTTVLPYSQALSRFPAHLQQLDMESNGKSVSRDGNPLSYSTGPVVFGEPGTNGQHSFYQLLHQGTDIVPLQFIGFRNPQTAFDVEVDGSSSARKLNANLAAQIVAFAKGQDHDVPSKRFPGNRPSSLLYAEKLTPRSLGALLSHFENKVMFQGFLWNINSFDQEGVQLGKLLAKRLLSGDSGDPLLRAYFRLLTD